MAFTLIVTNAGRAALVNAAHNGTAPVTITQCGLSPNALAPSPAATALPGELKRIATLSGDVVAADMIHLIVRDEGSDAYSVRSLALYLADGTLFAIYGQADDVVQKSAQAMLNLAIDITFADVDATQLTFGNTNFLNPPATTSVQGVVELATEAEAETGTDAARAVTPKGMKSAVTSWLNSRLGDGAPSAFMKGLLTTASATALRLSLGIKSAALKDEGDGNGLHADLLDGQHGSWYANILDRLGFTPVQQGGGTGMLTNKVRIGWSGDRLKAAVDATDLGSIVFDSQMTKGNVGLGNVDNTSDVAKPVSAATQTALTGKTDRTSAARPGVIRLYRRDADTAHNVQINWDGTRWFLRGYDVDTFQAECRVSYADSAGNAASASSVAWGNVSGRPTALSSFNNDSGYITAGGRAFPRRSDGGNLNFNWDGQGGQPQWLWGGSDGTNMYVYNPSNFSVNYANSANYSNSSGYANSAGQLSTAEGSPPSYAARAWVSFRGTGTVTILSAGNVSSVTDNGTGFYTANFATAMPDANYAAVPWGRSAGSSYREAMAGALSSDTKTTSSFRFRTGSTGSDSLIDAYEATVIVLR